MSKTFFNMAVVRHLES